MIKFHLRLSQIMPSVPLRFMNNSETMNLLVIGKIDIFQILSLCFTEPVYIRFRICCYRYKLPANNILHIYRAYERNYWRNISSFTCIFHCCIVRIFCFYVVKYLNINVVKIEITRFSNLYSYLTSRTYVL